MAPPVEVKTNLEALRASRRLERVHGADHVQASVEARVGHRATHVDLGRQVEDALGPEPLDGGEDRLGVGDVELGHLTPGLEAPARFSRLPLEKSSSTSTSSPRAAKASTRCEPMNPAPPVTTDLTRAAYGRKRNAE